MTNEQILLLSRIRVGLQRAGVMVDLVRMTRDRPYLEEVLFRASELPDEVPVQSAMLLMSQLGLINGKRVMDNSLKAEILRRFDEPAGGGQNLRGVAALGATPAGSSSQPDAQPIQTGQFSTPLGGTTTGTTGVAVPGGKSYKRGLR